MMQLLNIIGITFFFGLGIFAGLSASNQSDTTHWVMVYTLCCFSGASLGAIIVYFIANE